MERSAESASPRTSHPRAGAWDGFLAGPENALAHATVLAMARGESEGLSPLVLHGPSGSGKSRLLSGLLAERLARRPESAVARIEAQEFAASCSEAVDRPGGWTELRDRFRRLDLFILEDLHALERSTLALNELTHTLDALDDSGTSVAVSARSGPGQWSGWPARLVNRLMGGLSVRIDPPGVSSRRRYLLEQARVRGVHLSAEAVEALSGSESADGYRAIDGLLSRLSLTSRVERRPMDHALVESLLSEEEDSASAAVTVDRIAREVASRFGVRLRDLRSADRRRTLVEPRQLAMHLARDLTDLSFASIGAYFGRRDPATVRHSCRTAAARLAADPALASTLAPLRQSRRAKDSE